MANDYSRWYRAGTVNVTKGSKIVTGTDTYWLAASLHAGDIFSIDSTKSYEVDSVTDNTHLTLKTVYAESTASGVSYEIVRNFTATLPAEVASQTSELIYDVRRYIDTDMKSLYGKSAYEVAKAGGYSGSESEWLTSLIGAGQWDILDDRTEMLDEPAWPLKNALFRGKNLGTAPTAEQLAAIADNSFRGLWLGDYWKDARGMRWRIWHFNYYRTQYVHNGYVHNDPLTGESRWPNWYPHENIAANERTNDLGNVDRGYQYMPPHVIVKPDDAVASGPYYDLEFNAENMFCGYLKSNWYVNIRPAVLQRIIDTFGDEHVLEWKDQFISGYNSTGWATGRVLSYGRCELPTWYQMTGKMLDDESQTTRACGGSLHNSEFECGRFALESVAPTMFRRLWRGEILRDCVGTGKTADGVSFLRMGSRSFGYWSGQNSTIADIAVQPYFCLG